MLTDRLKLSAPWADVKEQLKEADIRLTDEDLDYSPGQEEELLSRLEKKLQKSRQEVKAWIESVSSNRGLAF